MAADGDERDLGSARILAFSDGVFAIATTLLVLNLFLPKVGHDLLHALGREWPQFLSYAVSFLIIGTLWANHHHMFNQIVRSDHHFMIVNVLFLMWIAFLPFPASLLGQYLNSPAERQTAMEVYAGTFFVGTILINAVWRYGTRGERLTGANPDHEVILKTNRSYVFGVILYLIDFALAFVSAEASLVLFFLLALLYALSPFPGATKMPTTRGSSASVGR